jgi:hypothetical protein
MGLGGGMGLEALRPMSHGRIGGGAVLFGALLGLGAGCLRPTCEAPGSCPHAEGVLDAGGERDAGPDAGIDAGADGGPDAGGDVGCTESSDCPSGTECDFRCSGDPSANQPYVRYNLAHGVCRPNLSGCAEQPDVCNDPVAGYCDFEGRCVWMTGLCEKPFGCPSDCIQAGPCGCICNTCPATAAGGQ